MPKDNESVPLPISLDGPIEAAPEPFTADQMVRCESCLRANPPTRVNCLYCGDVLPLTEGKLDLQKPSLRPLEKWEHGYNNILMPPTANLTQENLALAADLLRLSPDDLNRILSSALSLPLARAATMDEASLVQRRLTGLGVDSWIMPDIEPGEDPAGPIRVRLLDLGDEGVRAYRTHETPPLELTWADLGLLVAGRLIVKRVELKEQTGSRKENRILADSEFITDESVVDLYDRKHATPLRIAANNFDFSCLGEKKGLVATENISTLISLLRGFAPAAEYDESFNSARRLLDPVWPFEQQIEAGGWHRERPGKYSIGSITERNNEKQFQRYSRLRYYCQFRTNRESNA